MILPGCRSSSSLIPSPRDVDELDPLEVRKIEVGEIQVVEFGSANHLSRVVGHGGKIVAAAGLLVVSLQDFDDKVIAGRRPDKFVAAPARR